jgi:hypothetical protein
MNSNFIQKKKCTQNTNKIPGFLIECVCFHISFFFGCSVRIWKEKVEDVVQVTDLRFTLNWLKQFTYIFFFWFLDCLVPLWSLAPFFQFGSHICKAFDFLFISTLKHFQQHISMSENNSNQSYSSKNCSFSNFSLVEGYNLVILFSFRKSRKDDL